MLSHQTVLETLHLILILNVTIIPVDIDSQINIIVSLLRYSYDWNTNSLTDCVLCVCLFMTQATKFKCAKTLLWVICILISHYRVSYLNFHLLLISFCVYYCFNEIILVLHTQTSIQFGKSNLYSDFTPINTSVWTLYLKAVWYEILVK